MVFPLSVFGHCFLMGPGVTKAIFRSERFDSSLDLQPLDFLRPPMAAGPLKLEIGFWHKVFFFYGVLPSFVFSLTATQF